MARTLRVVAGEETEADLDVDWSGGVAPNAMIALVVSESKESSSGVDLSSLYVVDNDLLTPDERGTHPRVPP
jgi:subtilase family serine protease